MTPRILVLCTVSTGLDAVAEVLRNDLAIEAIVGVHPAQADSTVISGYVDISAFAEKWKVKLLYVNRYDLKNEQDKELLSSESFDLIWVSGWQRLIPEWLISLAPLGALGGHGSPDGIKGGRGRSPQNWAIMLGCRRFDLALFRITPGVDDGPVVAQRSFYYNETDDISVSYKKAALCSGEMMLEVLRNPALIHQAIPQAGEDFYYPQRKPEDGYVDWNLSCREIWAHCRALTRPYPGLRTVTSDGHEVTIWQCIPFDDQVQNTPGTISFIFEDKCFLVQTRDGRLLVNDYESQRKDSSLKIKDSFVSRDYNETMTRIIKRHREKMPNYRLAMRVSQKT
jgi:UDP-4-amino-4-deoxy-L-arabinose formyltransferase/UDP-glucuronic acid dehydrogenase (UDP-4-keto-hexauronic acid decarboxylating)